MCKIQLGNTLNTRSLSYLVNKENKRIKDNLIIRSDNLSLLDSFDAQILKNEYNLRRIIDLRTKKEALNDPDIRIENASYFLNSILEDDKIGITKTDGPKTQDDFIRNLHEEGVEKSLIFMENTYKSLVYSSHALKAYSRFIDLVLKSEGTVLYHCSAGKDRAGFATIILLYILDFDLDVIKEDYLLTNKFYQDKIENDVKKFGSEYREILKCVYGVKEEYFDILFDTICLSYNDFDDFLAKALGVTPKIKNKLKEKYLV